MDGSFEIWRAPAGRGRWWRQRRVGAGWGFVTALAVAAAGFGVILAVDIAGSHIRTAGVVALSSAGGG